MAILVSGRRENRRAFSWANGMDSNESGEQWLNSGCVLNIEQIRFPDTTPHTLQKNGL